MRDGRKKGACVSPLSTHGEPRGESTKTSPVRTNTPKQTLACQLGSLLSLSLCLFSFSSSLPHNAARTEHILSPNNGFRRVCLPLQHDAEKGMSGSGERKRRREERCSKSQEGGIHVDVGEIHHPPSLFFFFFFFFITEGKQGPPQSLPHHHKYGCWEECAGEA